MNLDNGHPVKPAILIYWDPENQAVQVAVDPEQVKNWDFALGLIEMAKGAALMQQKMIQLQEMNRRQAERQQVDFLRRQIKP